MLRVLVPLAVVVLLFAGCPAGPNGKEGVLTFVHEYPAVVQGMTFDVLVPERSGDLTWDFDQTVIEVDTPGDTFLDDMGRSEGPAWADDPEVGGWLLRLRCESSGEVRIRVLHLGEVRYEDATDIQCVAPASVEVGLPSQEAYWKGDTFQANLFLHATDEAGAPLELGGHGVKFGSLDPIVRTFDPLDEVQPSWEFQAVKGGEGFELLLGDTTVPFPVTVADDDWVLTVTARKATISGQNDPVVHLHTDAKTGSGKALVPADCVYVFTPDAQVAQASDDCDRYLKGPWSGEACVTLKAKTACTEFTW